MIQNIKKSWDLLIDNYLKVGLISLLEIIFFFIYGFFYGPIRNGIGNSLLGLGDEIVTGADNGVLMLSSNYTINLIILTLLLWVISYLLYSIFQGLIWKYCIGFSYKTEKYMKKFFLINIIWGIIFGAYFIIDFIISYLDILTSRMNWIIIVLETISKLILILLIYFMIISYIILINNKIFFSFKKCFKSGLKKINSWGIMFIYIGVILIILNYLIYIGFLINEIFGIIFGIFLLMPFLVYMRILLSRYLHET